MKWITKGKRTRFWFAAWATVAVMVASSVARAAEQVVVLSIKPSTQLFSDVEYLLEATGMAGVGELFLPQVKGFFQGIDGSKPIGVTVGVEGSEFKAMGFVPVKDLDLVLKQLQEQMGEPREVGDGVLELQGPQPVYLKEQNGWAFIAQSADSLKTLPEAPEKMLDGLDSQYDIAIRAFVKNVPDAYKQMAIDQVQQGVEQSLEDEDDPNAKKMAEAQVAQIKQMIQETETFTIGWQIDGSKRETYLDMTVTAQPNTKMAEQMKSMRDSKTAFGSFLVPDSAIRANLSSIIPPDQMEQSLASIDQLQQSALKEIAQDDDLDDATRAGATKLVETFFEIIRGTVKTGKMDGAASVVLKPKSMTIVSATHVSSGAEVEAALKQLVDMAKDSPDIAFSSVKFNASEHAGVRFHTMALPIPEEEYLRKVLGDTLQVVVGTSDKAAYVALGADGMETLKGLLDQGKSAQATSVDPFLLEAALTPILKFADSIEPNPVVSALAETLAGAEGKDHIRVRTVAVENGGMYRLLLEEGVLKAIGQATQMVGSQNDF